MVAEACNVERESKLADKINECVPDVARRDTALRNVSTKKTPRYDICT